MPATTPRGFHYLLPGDAPDIAAATQNLATDIDNYFGGAWTTFTGMATGVSANTFGYAPAWRLREGGTKVELRGGMKASPTFNTSGANTLVAAIPTAIHPAQIVEVPCATNYASAVTTNTRIEVSSAGALTLYAGAGDVAWVSLDGITYYLA